MRIMVKISSPAEWKPNIISVCSTMPHDNLENNRQILKSETVKKPLLEKTWQLYTWLRASIYSKRISAINGKTFLHPCGAVALQNEDDSAVRWERVAMRSQTVKSQCLVVTAASETLSRGRRCGLASSLAPLSATPFSRLSVGGVQSSDGCDDDTAGGRDAAAAARLLPPRLLRRRRAEDTLSVVHKQHLIRHHFHLTWHLAQRRLTCWLCHKMCP